MGASAGCTLFLCGYGAERGQKRKERRLHRLPLFDLVRLRRIRVIKLIGVSMRIIQDVRPMTPVCNTNVGIKNENAKLFPNFMHICVRNMHMQSCDCILM